MSLPAIEVSGLSKRYVIEHESRHDNLRDTLHHAARKLWRRARWGTGFEREEFWALRDVSFSIQPGEVVGIIGRNGAGKSTLLKILSRITEPTSGKVAIRGRVASLLEVGTGFHPDLTGRENVYLNGAILGMSRAEISKKFDEIVAFAEIERFLDTPVKRYSSGMYVRLAFAVAAHLEPEILFLDEVLAVGDGNFQKKCITKIKNIAAESGRTVLLVSHQMQNIEAMCNTGILLEGGKVAEAGRIGHVLAAYANLWGRTIGTVVEKADHIDLKQVRWERDVDSRRSDEDVSFELAFDIGPINLPSVVVDCAIYNARAEMVLHLQSHQLGREFSFDRDSSPTLKVVINAPMLAPGDYSLTVFVATADPNNRKILLWIEGIPGLRVSNIAHFGPYPMVTQHRGSTIPKFEYHKTS
ncbi:MAG: ABC transporter ATP-binding protein [Opitutaceae bacterium]|jgi:ABC-type polysaccharide/polyol phosphate transport system ATPase subunit|nr:ABC transporter ATP-binding protein [Opitutaceae bacterium]